MAKETWQQRLKRARDKEAQADRRGQIAVLAYTEENHKALRKRTNPNFRRIIKQRRTS